MTSAGVEEAGDDARLWIFALKDELGEADEAAFLASVDRFLDKWRAHGAPIRSARSLSYRRFLFVAVQASGTQPSGCAIDSLTRGVSAVAREIGTRVLDNGAVWYRDARGRIAWTTRAGFRKEAASGRIRLDTTVFNNSLTQVDQLRSGEWEVPARASWQAAFFR